MCLIRKLSQSLFGSFEIGHRIFIELHKPATSFTDDSKELQFKLLKEFTDLLFAWCQWSFGNTDSVTKFYTTINRFNVWFVFWFRFGPKLLEDVTDFWELVLALIQQFSNPQTLLLSEPFQHSVWPTWSPRNRQCSLCLSLFFNFVGNADSKFFVLG